MAPLFTLAIGRKKAQPAKFIPKLTRPSEVFMAKAKPIGAMCIAPVLLAKVLGSQEITITIGNDKETAQEIEKTGAQHENCQVEDYISDRESKIVTTPAYMYGDAKPHLVYQGIRAMVKEVVEMA